MLTEPPGEALVRTSTYSLPSDQPGGIDLTTVYALTSSIDLPTLDPALIPAPNGRSLIPSEIHTTAIYAIEGDWLTYCVAPPGQPRPTEFVTRKGDGCTMVWAKKVPAK